MLGNNIRKYRKENNISQEDLAEKLGVTRQSISLWENNQTQPSIDNIIAITKVFGSSTDDLLLSATEEQEENIEDILNDDITKNEKIKNKLSKKNKIMFLSVGIVTVAIISVLVTLFLIKNSDKNRLKNADDAVVKIVCYDPLGNMVSTGSGFFYSDAAHVVTNYHVIEDAYKIVCITSDDVSHDVDYIYYYSEEMDLAVIVPKDIDYNNLVYLENSKTEIEKGATVYAIGSPLGIQNTLSQGIISGRHSTNGIEAIQFTASISSGSSGGALLDEKGRVLGITFASYQNGQNLNLAIPIELLDKACPKWNDSMALLVSGNYIEKHKYAKDLEILKKINPELELVTLEAVKSDIDKYKGKTIAINTYLSAISVPSSENPNTYLYSICEKENISHSFDDDLVSFVRYEIEKSPYLITRGRYEKDDHIGKLKSGDNVWLICSNMNDENDVFMLLMMYNPETEEYVSIVPTLVNTLKERQNQ